MKDAFRDVYSVIVLYAYKSEIDSGLVTRSELVRTITPERIARVEDVAACERECCRLGSRFWQGRDDKG